MRSLPLMRILPAMMVPRARMCTASASPAPFDKLSSKLQTITRLQRLSAVANWDQLVMMPSVRLR